MAPMRTREDEGLRSALERAGGPARLAMLLGISQEAVTQWRRVPIGRVAEVEAATGIPRRVLRPDVFEAREIV